MLQRYFSWVRKSQHVISLLPLLIKIYYYYFIILKNLITYVYIELYGASEPAVHTLFTAVLKNFHQHFVYFSFKKLQSS